MMEYFEMHDEAKSIRDGVEWTLSNGFVTKDIDPVNSYFTSTVGELISDHISNDIPQNVNLKNMTLGQATII